MQLTKELLDNEISTVEQRLEQIKAQANSIAGALSTLKDMRAFLDKEEEKPKEDISPENAAIQARDEAALEPQPGNVAEQNNVPTNRHERRKNKASQVEKA